MATARAKAQAFLKTVGRLVKPVEIIVVPPKHAVTMAAAAQHLKKQKRKPSPHDIIVMGSKAGHFTGTTIISAAHEPRGADPTVVKLSASRQEVIAWHSKKRFSIIDIEPVDTFRFAGKAYRGPNNPFYRDLPFRSSPGNLVISGPVRDDGKHGRFKVVLKIGNRRIDPHIDT